MAGNVPNVSRDSFDWSKFYDSVVLQQGVPIPDSDWNEANDVLQISRMMLARIAVGNTTFSDSGASTGYTMAEAVSPANNFLIELGWATVDGVLVPTTAASPPADHDYEDDTNLICEGTLDAAASLILTDSDKYWESFHDLVGCRVKMTSGTESGNEFPITSNPSATTIGCSGGIGAIAPGDTYIIKPPVLTTPGGARTDEAYLMAWFEDINENEDTNIVHPGLGVETSHRRQRRWCVRVAEGGATPSTPSVYSFGVRYLKLAEFARTAVANITTGIITNESYSGSTLGGLGTAYAQTISDFSSGLVPWDWIPDADDTLDLGSTARQWKDIYIDGIAYVDSLSLSTSAGEGVASSLVPIADDSFDLGASGYQWKDAYIDGVAYVDTLSLSSTAGEGIGSHAVPTTDNTYDLGASGYEWKDLYIDGVATVDTLSVSNAAGEGLDTDLFPTSDVSKTLGDPSYRFLDVHAAHAEINSITPESEGLTVTGMTGGTLGHGIKSTSNGTLGRGVWAVCGGADGYGVYAEGGTAGHGVYAKGGSASGPGVEGLGIGSGAWGVTGKGGPATGIGVRGEGVGTGVGVYGIAGTSGGAGVYGLNGAGSNSPGVEGLCDGGNAGVKGTGSGTAYGGWFAGSGTAAPLHLEERAADPTSLLADGDIWVTTAGAFKVRLNGTTRTVTVT